MTINDIKTALALAAKAQNMNIHPVTPAGTVKPSTPAKTKPTTTTTATKKPATTTTVTPVPVTKDVAPVVTAPVKVENQPMPMVDQETKPVTVTTKKTSTRKTKTATVIPMDSIEVVVKNLKSGVDFSLIPGLGKKPVLLKAGAEKLASIYGLRSTSQVINRVENYSQMFVLYEVETIIYDSEGNILAVGLGSANTRERKYRNGDFATNLHTVLLMARKRSFVSGIITATHAAGVFTQDEDIITDNMKREAVG